MTKTYGCENEKVISFGYVVGQRNLETVQVKVQNISEVPTHRIIFESLKYCCNPSREPKGNLLVIVILSRGKCGLSKCTARYLAGMAMADLVSVVSGVLLDQINNIYQYSRYLLITPICALSLVVRLSAMDSSVWLTVAFTFDRSIAICSQKLKERYCTERTAAVLTVMVPIVTCARYVPCYFAVKPLDIIDRVPWYCIQNDEFVASPLFQAYEVFNCIMTPLLPFSLIVLFNALTISHIIFVNKLRRSLRTNSGLERDSEVENRRKSMFLLFALSINFILLWIPFTIYNLTWPIQNYFYTDKYLNTPIYVLQQCGFMLQFLSTCTNTCIYTLSQRAFRKQLKNGYDEEITSINIQTYKENQQLQELDNRFHAYPLCMESSIELLTAIISAPAWCRHLEAAVLLNLSEVKGLTPV
ncbi:probable G-protein coupled receptor 139 [Narcine bancroftii]|uniref:probable G-protein coupled receptor 139 n=1 Tax=Narcine bancroftii TaxID=1343680 RepID=UPI003831CFF8